MKLAFQFVLKRFRWFNNQFCFNYHETIDIKLELLIIYDFPRNDTPALHTPFCVMYKKIL